MQPHKKIKLPLIPTMCCFGFVVGHSNFLEPSDQPSSVVPLLIVGYDYFTVSLHSTHGKHACREGCARDCQCSLKSGQNSHQSLPCSWTRIHCIRSNPPFCIQSSQPGPHNHWQQPNGRKPCLIPTDTPPATTFRLCNSLCHCWYQCTDVWPGHCGQLRPWLNSPMVSVTKDWGVHNTNLT